MAQRTIESIHSLQKGVFAVKSNCVGFKTFPVNMGPLKAVVLVGVERTSASNSIANKTIIAASLIFDILSSRKPTEFFLLTVCTFRAFEQKTTCSL